MLAARYRVWLQLGIGALAAASWGWAPTAHAQAPGQPAPPCQRHWIYHAPASTAYLRPLFVSDAVGNLFWWEEGTPAELVSVRDGTVRWRTRVNARGRGSFLPSAMLVRDDLLLIAVQATIAGLRTSDGAIVWSRDVEVDLGPQLHKAKVPRDAAVYNITAARLGRALVTSVEAGQTAWLVATAFDGKPLWTRRLPGVALELVTEGDHLYALFPQPPSGALAIAAVDRRGTVGAPPPDLRPGGGAQFGLSEALHRDEVVFDEARVVTAAIAPLPTHCPPQSPSCHAPPLMLTVTGYAAGAERWQLTQSATGFAPELLLPSDSSVLLVYNGRVGRISPDGQLTPLCDAPAEPHSRVAALVHGDVVVTYGDSAAAYNVPGGPSLAATGWVMHGGGPTQDWVVRVAPGHDTARPAVPVAPFVLFPAGVADPAAEVAYVQGDSGVAMALALADGTVRWRTHGPARPVGIWNGRIVAVTPGAGGLRVAQLDPASGVALAASQPIPLAGVDSVTLSPWGGEPLTIEVAIAGDRARIHWDVAINGGRGGATIGAYGDSGGADVDLASGTASLAPTKHWQAAGVRGGIPGHRTEWPPSTIVSGRKFSLFYAATATLTATDARTGALLWTRRLWTIAAPPRDRIAVPG
jgi:outer membrane protein assembly factor BamB